MQWRRSPARGNTSPHCRMKMLNWCHESHGYNPGYSVIQQYCHKSRLSIKAYDSSIRNQSFFTYHTCMDTDPILSATLNRTTRRMPTTSRGKQIMEGLRRERNLHISTELKRWQFIQYNPLPVDYHDQNAKQTKTREIRNTEENDWGAQVKLSDNHNAYLAKSLHMHSEFQSMWDGHFRGIKAAIHRVEVKSAGERLTRLAPYRACHEPKNFKKHKIDKILARDIIEQAQKEWEAPFLFAPKKYRAFGFRVAYRKPNAPTVLDSSCIPHMNECIDSHNDFFIFSPLDGNRGYWQAKFVHEVGDRTAFRLFMKYSDFSNAIRLYNCALDGSTRNGYHSVLGEVAVCRCLSKWYSHILKVPKLPYRAPMPSLDVIERQWENTKTGRAWVLQ